MKFVLFGSTGDLAKLKILPALLHLAENKKLPKDFELIAVGRRDYSLGDYKNYLQTAEVNPLTDSIDVLNPSYIQLDWESEGGFTNLWNNITEGEEVLIYLSLGFEVVAQTIARFQDSGSMEALENLKPRISVEKPFGGNLIQA